MGEVDRFVSLIHPIPPDERTSEKISLHITKIQLARTNLRHLCRRHDICLPIKSRVHAEAVRSILLCGPVIWPLRSDVRNLSVLEHLSFYFFTNSEVKPKLSNPTGQFLEGTE